MNLVDVFDGINRAIKIVLIALFVALGSEVARMFNPTLFLRGWVGLGRLASGISMYRIDFYAVMIVLLFYFITVIGGLLLIYGAYRILKVSSNLVSINRSKFNIAYYGSIILLVGVVISAIYYITYPIIGNLMVGVLASSQNFNQGSILISTHLIRIVLFEGFIVFGTILIGIGILRLEDITAISSDIKIGAILTILGSLLLLSPYISIVGGVTVLIGMILLMQGSKNKVRELMHQGI